MERLARSLCWDLLAVIGAAVVLALLTPGAGLGGVEKSRLKPPEPGMVHVLKTTQGSTIIGAIVQTTDSEVVYRTEVGEMRIPIASIERLEEIPAGAIRKGQYWFPDPSAGRLYMFPTARMLPAGQGYFTDYWIFFPAVGYGITDWLTLGAGMSLFPGVGLDKQLYYLTPKVGVGVTDNLDVSAGALLLKIPEIDDDDDVPLVGMLEGVATYGNDYAAFTAGVGYGFADKELADRPLILLGGTARLTRRTVLVSENFLIPGVDDALILYGLRFIGESLSADLGFFTPTGEDFIFPGIPYVAFGFSF